MNHARLWVAATIIAIVVLTGFILSVPHTRDVEETPALNNVVTIPPVSVRDTFKKGLHTITGSIEVPNACTTISTDTSITGDASSTQSILVAITMPADEGICLQTPTRVTFQTTISAVAGLPIIATVNGVVATTSSP